jgi:RHS repeat-associated protein
VKKDNGKLYWYGLGGEVLLETDLNDNLLWEFVYFGGAKIARRDADGTIHYFFADHLGTNRVMTSATGVTQQESTYYPFGGEQREITSTVDNRWKFTGLERDDESGLDNTLFRKYASNLARWLSPDPLAGDVSDPQSLNRYSYVRNNPTNLADPLGLQSPGNPFPPMPDLNPNKACLWGNASLAGIPGMCPEPPGTTVCLLDGQQYPCHYAWLLVQAGAAEPGPLSTTRYNPASGGFEIYEVTTEGSGWTPFGPGYLPGTNWTASPQDRVNQVMADSGLSAKGNVDYSKCEATSSDGCPRWIGYGYRLILTQAGVGLLRSPDFLVGRLGGMLHVKDVGATSWREVWDFRSYMGRFGPGSMQVVVRQLGYVSFVHLDRWNPYEGLWPLLAHLLFETLF